jgi:hypothetical protein
MASLIIGSAIDSKVLQRQNFNKEPNGLETIIEAYAIKTANRDTVIPARFTLHSNFSSSSKKYIRMAVDSVATEEQDGGITQMLVTYVGLTTESGLPPPIVRLIPTAGEGVYGPPLIIEAEYVTDVSETNFLLGQVAQNNALERATVWQTTVRMPEFINGYPMPKNLEAKFSVGGAVIENYSGYCYLSKSCEKRGLFLVARDTFHEVQQVGIIR